MAINFIGDFPSRNRVVTGFTSFDYAVAGKLSKHQLGMPLRCGYHVYGRTGVGKTTVCLSLAGLIARETGKAIALSPIDTFDPDMARDILEHAAQGKDLNVYFELKDTDEKTTKALGVRFSDDSVGFALLDSAMAIMPISEGEGDPGDANMGRRAKIMGTFCRQMFHFQTQSDVDKVWFVTNHLLPNIGSLGNYTPGGKALLGLTSIHIKLQQARIKNKAIEFENGRLLEGTVEKNNFGPSSKKFYWFVIGGVGIHSGLTAVYDAIAYGLASEGRKIEVNGQKVASIRDMVENYEDDNIFIPFIEALKEMKTSTTTDTKPVEDESSVEDVLAGEEQYD